MTRDEFVSEVQRAMEDGDLDAFDRLVADFNEKEARLEQLRSALRSTSDALVASQPEISSAVCLELLRDSVRLLYAMLASSTPLSKRWVSLAREVMGRVSELERETSRPSSNIQSVETFNQSARTP